MRKLWYGTQSKFLICGCFSLRLWTAYAALMSKRPWPPLRKVSTPFRISCSIKGLMSSTERGQSPWPMNTAVLSLHIITQKIKKRSHKKRLRRKTHSFLLLHNYKTTLISSKRLQACVFTQIIIVLRTSKNAQELSLCYTKSYLFL